MSQYDQAKASLGLWPTAWNLCAPLRSRPDWPFE